MKDVLKRTLALFMAMVVMATSMPLQAFAENTVTIDDPEIIQQIVEGNTDVLQEQLDGTEEPVLTPVPALEPEREEIFIPQPEQTPEQVENTESDEEPVLPETTEEVETPAPIETPQPEAEPTAEPTIQPTEAPETTLGVAEDIVPDISVGDVDTDIPGTEVIEPDKNTVIASGTCGDLDWQLTGNGTLTLSGEGDPDDYYDDDLTPWYDYRESITEIIFEEGVWSVSAGLFMGLENVKTISFPSSIGYFEVFGAGKGPFSDCINLESFIVSDNCKNLSSSNGLLYINTNNELICCPAAKSGTADISMGTEYLNENAFDNCVGIDTLILHKYITTANCDLKELPSLKTIYFKGTESEWADSPFYEMFKDSTDINIIYDYVDNSIIAEGQVNDNIDWSLDAMGVLTIRGTGDIGDYEQPIGNVLPGPWSEYRYNIIKIVVEEGITSVGNYNFCCCTNLREIKFPDTLKRIGENVFGFCQLKELNIPENVTEIYAGAFNSTDGTKSITVADGNTAFTAENNILYSKDKTKVIYAARLAEHGEIVLPETIETIEMHAFESALFLSKVTIPEGCVSIGELAFSRSGLTTVTIPSTVTTLGKGAFGGTKIKSVEVPSGIKELPAGIFMRCGNLRHIDLPEGLEKIGSYAFSGCVLSEIEIPKTVSFIDKGAFSFCDNLKEVVLPHGISDIPEETFYICYGLESIVIPDTVISIGDSAFCLNENLKNIYFTGSREQWNAITIGEENESLLNADITYNYTGEEIPEEKTYTITVTQPEHGTLSVDKAEAKAGETITVTAVPETGYELAAVYVDGAEIEGNTFTVNGDHTVSADFCIINYTVTIVQPDNGIVETDKTKVAYGDIVTVTALRNYGYELYAIYVDGVSINGNTFTVTGNHTVTAVFTLKWYSIVVAESENGTVTTDTTVARIGDTVTVTATPNEGYELEAIYVDGVAIEGKTFIVSGNHAVSADFNKTTVYYTITVEQPEHGVLNIDKTKAAAGETITITVVPDIGYELLTIYVDGIQIEGNTFTVSENHTVYAEFIYKDSVDSGRCGENIVWWIDSMGTLTLSGTGRMASYYSCEEVPWYSFKDNIKHIFISDGITSISSYSFSELINLIDVSMPDTMIEIGRDSFKGCRSIQEMTLSKNIKYINTGAFSYCGIKEITIPGSVSYMGMYVFESSSLKKVTIENGIDYIAYGSFQNCSLLEEIIIPESVTSIEDAAFYKCEKLNNVVLPIKLEKLGVMSFGYCTSLKEISIPGSLKEIGNSAFYRCYNISDLIINYGVEIIGDDAFYYCEQLTNITIPESILAINKGAFYRCALNEIEIPDSVKEIGDGAFGNCNLEKVIIGISVEIIGNNPFCYNDNLSDFITKKENKYFKTDESGILVSVDKERIICAPKSLTGFYSIPYYVKKIDSRAFASCNSITGIEIPSNVESIGWGAFSNCFYINKVIYRATNMNNMEQANSVFHDVGRYADSTTLIIGSEVCAIPESLFFSLWSDYYEFASGPTFTTVIFEKNSKCTGIGDYAFYGCNSIENIYYGDSKSNWDLINIGEYNENLTSATIYYESTGPGTGYTDEDLEAGQGGEDIVSDNTFSVRYLTEWSAETQTATFAGVTNPQSIVTDGTDTSFIENIDELLNHYVLVEVKSDETLPVATDYLISMKPVSTHYGKITAFDASSITIDNVGYKLASHIDTTFPQTYVGEALLYHMINNEVVGIEILKAVTGTVKTGNISTGTLTIYVEGEGTNIQYTLSSMAKDVPDDIYNHGEKVKLLVDTMYKFYDACIVEEQFIPKVFDPLVDGFSFENSPYDFFTKNELPYWKNYEQKTVSYVDRLLNKDRQKGSIELSDDALNKLISAIPSDDLSQRERLTDRLYRKWGGSCHGMAAISIIRFAMPDLLPLYSIEPNSIFTKTYDLTSPNRSSNVEDLVNYYHLLQAFDAIQVQYDILKEETKENYSSSIKKLISNIKYDNIPVLASIFVQEKNEDGNGFKNTLGHAVVLTSVIEETNNYYIAEVYDPNCSGEMQVMTIYKSQDTTLSDDSIHIKYTSGTSSNSEESVYNTIRMYLSTIELIDYINYFDSTAQSNLSDLIEISVPIDTDISLHSETSKLEYKSNSVIYSEGLLGPYYELGALVDGKDTSYITFKTDNLVDLMSLSINSSEKSLNSDIIISLPNMYLSLNSDNPVDISIDVEQGKIYANSEKDSTVNIKVTQNDISEKWPWHSVAFDAENCTEFSIDLNDDNTVISGDNLDDVSLAVKNDDETKNIDVNTDSDKIILRQDENGEIIVCENPSVSLSHQYLLSQVGESNTITATPSYDVELTWTVEGDSVEITPSGNSCAFTAVAPGTSYVVASAVFGEQTVYARCRVDVTESVPAATISAAHLTEKTATSNIYSTDYAQLNVHFDLEQNMSVMDTESTVPADTGLAVEDAYFTNEAAKTVFDLRVKDDRTLEIIPVVDVTDAAAVKAVKGSYKTQVTVVVNGEEYTTVETVTLKTAKKLPAVKANAVKLNSFYTEHTLPLVFSNPDVTAVSVDESKRTAKVPAIPAWLELNEDMTVSLKEDFAGKGSGKLYLEAEVEGWTVPVKVTVSVSVANTAPKLKLSQTKAVFNTYRDKAVATEISLLSANKKVAFDTINVTNVRVADPAELTVKEQTTYKAGENYAVTAYGIRTGAIVLDVAEGKEAVSGKVMLLASIAGSQQKIKLPVTVTAYTKALSFKLAKTSVTLNTHYAETSDTVSLKVTATPADYLINTDNFSWTITDTKGNELSQIALDVAFADNTVTVRANETTAAGKYKVVFALEDAAKTVTLNVTVKAPVLKLSKTAVTLNKLLADSTEITLKATPADYQFTEDNISWIITDDKNNELPADTLTVEREEGTVKVSVNENTEYGQTYKVVFELTETGKTTALTVKTLAQTKSVAKVALSVKGKLQTGYVDKGVTVTAKWTNLAGGADIRDNLKVYAKATAKGSVAVDVTDRFDIVSNGDGTYTVKYRSLDAMKELNHKDKYTIVAEGVVVNDQSVADSKAVAIGVTFTKPKVNQDVKSVKLYLNDKYSRGEVRLTLKDSTLPAIAKVEIAESKISGYYDLENLGNGVYAIGFKDDEISPLIKAGTLKLNIYLAGNNPENKTPNATVSVKVENVKFKQQ